MINKTSLRELERTMFKESIQDGILDIQIGCMLLVFVLPIYLSPRLGDFWSSVIFLPLWFLVIYGLRAFRKKVVQPRIGTIQYGNFRQKRLVKLNILILVINLIALILGILSFIQFSEIPGWSYTTILSIILLIGFSLAGYMLEIPRIYLYGILISAAPVVGEYLYQNFGAAHHGFPITFGLLSGVLVITGVTLFIRLLQKYPAQDSLDIP